MKRKIETRDATPPKEIFRSIIADYDIRLGICELIDNSIDIWTRKGRIDPLNINLTFDTIQQKITIEDNAGGISQNEITLFISPGRTGNTGTEETIGIFGVGSKRAIVAMAQNIQVRTRQGNEKTISVEIDQEWLKEEGWNFDVHEVDPINKNTTIIELLGLRTAITNDYVQLISDHISFTYAKFLLNPKISIQINKTNAQAVEFDHSWAFPKGYEPKEIKLILPIENSKVTILIKAGLIGENASAGSEYGVYFYCNDRLIAKGIRNYEVGYTTGKAGRDHPSVALARIIIEIRGDAQFMPWNSSKSDVNYKHKVFEALRDELINIIRYYVSLSRGWQGVWHEKVFKFKTGKKQEIEVKSLQEIRNVYNIPLPQLRIKYKDTLKKKNKNLAKNKPWVIGLYEGIIVVDHLTNQSLEHKNRFALIVLDSTLEIAFKEYLANEASPRIGASKLHSLLHNRVDVISEIKNRVPKISTNDWSQVDYYYTMRCNLIHQKATSAVTDDEVESYRSLVEKILKILFKIKF